MHKCLVIQTYSRPILVINITKLGYLSSSNYISDIVVFLVGPPKNNLDAPSVRGSKPFYSTCSVSIAEVTKRQMDFGAGCRNKTPGESLELAA